VQFEKTYTHEFFKDLIQIALVLWTRAILIVFEKLTRACFSQIALETILLPKLNRKTLYIVHELKFLHPILYVVAIFVFL
jgi:hypothetical protein